MFSKIIGIIKLIVECFSVVGPMLKIPKLEKTIEALSAGVEAFSQKTGNEVVGKKVKCYIQDFACNAGVENYLHKKIKKFTKRQWKKLF